VYNIYRKAAWGFCNDAESRLFNKKIKKIKKSVFLREKRLTYPLGCGRI